MALDGAIQLRSAEFPAKKLSSEELGKKTDSLVVNLNNLIAKPSEKHIAEAFFKEGIQKIVVVLNLITYLMKT